MGISFHRFIAAANSSDACSDAKETCNDIFSEIINSKPGINVRDLTTYILYIYNQSMHENKYWSVLSHDDDLLVFKYYDIRKNCTGSLCFDFSNAENFLNEKEVQKALGVRDIYFVSCSTVVYSLMSDDWMKNFELGLPALLQDGIKLLIYAGEYDLICNWLGNIFHRIYKP